MAAENISKFRAWVNEMNMQLDSSARRFSEIEETFGYTTQQYDSILDLMQSLKVVELECESLRNKFAIPTNNIHEMIENVEFQMESLDNTFELLRKYSS